jgi:hypothetical protein
MTYLRKKKSKDNLSFHIFQRDTTFTEPSFRRVDKYPNRRVVSRKDIWGHALRLPISSQYHPSYLGH